MANRPSPGSPDRLCAPSKGPLLINTVLARLGHFVLLNPAIDLVGSNPGRRETSATVIRSTFTILTIDSMNWTL